MIYGSAPLGSTPLGGSPAAGDKDYAHTIQALALTLQIPVWIAKHSNPGTFALNVTVETPVIKTVSLPATQALTLTDHAPVPATRVFPSLLALTLTDQVPVHKIISLPATLALTLAFVTEETEVKPGPALFTTTLTQHTPVHNVSFQATTLDLTLSLGGQETEVLKQPALFTLTLSGLDVHIPGYNLTHRAQVLRMELKSPKNPHRFYLTPRIVRYIKDPIVTGGCSQCGTFLFEEVRGRRVRGERVSQGRNFDLNGGYNEDQWVKCGRCGFMNHPTRNRREKVGSRVGWGMKYDEIEAGG